MKVSILYQKIKRKARFDENFGLPCHINGVTNKRGLAMTILVYDIREHRMERFERGLRDAMPYANETLRVGEFRGSSRSELMWTTSATMESWTAFRRLWGRPIYLPYAFKRVGEGGHGQQSQHYAGTSFDCAQNLTTAGQAHMRQLARASGLWTYVEPVYLTPTWEV